MADDTRDESSSPAGAGTRTGEPPKKLPKGMVMGKDGKPCRACTSFADFSSFGKSTKAHAVRTGPPADCPADVEQLGRASWTLLHSIAAQYPARPSRAEQDDVTAFMRLFGKLYPCWVCAEDFQAFMVQNKVRAESRDDFGTWMCEAHNEVNRKLGKKEFDCSRWEERWRTGWKDGRCD